MVDDAILSREAAYIFRYAIGFEPVQGNMMHWRGYVRDNTGQSGELEIKIPPQFPNVPPIVKLGGSTHHPLANESGEIRTRSINRWNGTTHVYAIIKEAESMIGTAPFGAATKVESGQATQMLSSQLQMLKSELENKKQEYSSIQNQSAQQVVDNHNVDEMIQDALINLENEAYALEESFDDLEIKSIEFAKNFVDARKRYYLIAESKNNH